MEPSKNECGSRPDPVDGQETARPSVIPYSEGKCSVDAISFARSFSQEGTYTLSCVGDVGLLTENGLDWFVMMQKFQHITFAQPRLPHTISSLTGSYCKGN
jgi:hypothetical protein